MVHYDFIMMNLPASNLSTEFLKEFSGHYLLMYEFSAMYAVDIFFFISSFL